MEADGGWPARSTGITALPDRVRHHFHFSQRGPPGYEGMIQTRTQGRPDARSL